MEQDVPQFLRDHARHLRKPSASIAADTLRYGSSEGLTLLSLIATDGRSTYEGLLADARAVMSAGDASVAAPIDVEALAAAARVKAGQPGPGLDFTEAADLHQALRILRTTEKLLVDVDRIDAQANLAMGRFDYVEQILPEIAVGRETGWMLRTDLLHPELGRPGTSVATWLRSFNELFVGNSLSPIEIADGEGERFDRLSSATPRIIEDGPLVTLVMSVFAPDQSINVAIRSLLAQTWRNLEILVVDDCSPPQYRELIDSVVALDDRIRLLTMPHNGGTYKIRNFALAQARGEFVGFQDSDDWSHPERIERQLKPLLSDPTVVATMSPAVRVSPQLGASAVGYPGLRPNASSLLFRREVVLEALGGFDEVRKAADTEFELRLLMVFGETSLVTLKLPLALVQLTRESLSRGDFRLGHRDASRAAYRDAYVHWHSRIAAGRESARLVPGAPRRFPAPAPFVGDSGQAARTSDVLLFSDWRPGKLRYAGGVDEAAALADAGLVTAVAHGQAMRYAQRRRELLDPRLMALHADGRVISPLWRDDFRTRVLVVQDPELLSYPRPAEAVGLRADRVVVRASFPPRAPEGRWLVYEPAYVERRAEELFGVKPEWLPATSAIADALAEEGAREILPATRLSAIKVSSSPRSGLRGGRRPIIGTTDVVADPEDRPSWAALLASFPDDDRYDVRIRDPQHVLAGIAPGGQLPPNWLVTSGGSLTGFVRQLDIFVGLPMRSWGPEPAHAAVVAMGQGRVVVLDPAYEPFFGPAATYPVDQTPRQLVDALVQNRERFVAQQERGYHFVTDELSPSAFAARIGALADVKEKRSA